MAMLGAVAAASDLVEKDTLGDVLLQRPEKHPKTCILALEKGYELARRQLEPQQRKPLLSEPRSGRLSWQADLSLDHACRSAA
jgi:hypothetical protein